ncbi:MAG: S-methyl-5-thioribose-1-phosphate isomerase [Gammaproteobacteria bacterium]|nr:MAG: S-methyl-5-thioribose-1-phosphate isomerase [Gammaproteobacteria bacterium]
MPSVDELPRAVRHQDATVFLLDQRRLPGEVVIEAYTDAMSVERAIREMRVRGAPAIGMAAAWALVVELERSAERDPQQVRRHIEQLAGRLRAARPTAVNLAWAVDRMLVRLARAPAERDALIAQLADEAQRIEDEDRAICRAIGEHGLTLLRPDCGVLTHCNAGALAVSERGTALAPLYAAGERRLPVRIFADETRPVLQGARLTAWELGQAGLDVTLICDNMVAALMAEGAIDLVLVGTDRVTANGDVVNKIGTLGVAILAHHFGIPFYVACPSSTFDAATARGVEVEIEERDATEVTHVGGVAIAPAGVKVRNPAFDVTPADLVTGIITEYGIARAPLGINLRQLLSAA